jgi:hypothetical protein
VVAQVLLDQRLPLRTPRCGRCRGDGAEDDLLDPRRGRSVDQHPAAGHLEICFRSGRPEGHGRYAEHGVDAIERGRQTRRIVEVAAYELGARSGQRGSGGCGQVAHQGSYRPPLGKQPPGGGAALLASGAGDEDRGVGVNRCHGGHGVLSVDGGY